MTTRRALLGLAGAGLVAPRLAFAQAARTVTVAVIFAGESDEDEPAARPFFDEMERLGWVEGKNVSYDRHSGKGTRQYLESLASTVSGRAPDLIVATTGSLALAVMRENDSIPVVFTTTVDPVAAGLVASLARPGRNATGAFQLPGDAAPKRFELVRELFPKQKRVGALFDRGSIDFQRRQAAHREVARGMGLELVTEEFTNFEAIAKILARFRRSGVVVAEVTPSFLLFGRRREVVELAARNGVALVAGRLEWADAGALMSYGTEISDLQKRAARIANRVLKGARPGEIPVERTARFELVINDRVARGMGIAVPKSLLQRANRVID